MIYNFFHHYNNQLIKHMGMGNSYDSFAAVINVPKHVMDEWLQTKKSFARSKSIGEAHRRKTLEDMLLTKQISLDIYKHLMESEESDIDSAVSNFDDDVLIQARERFAK